MRRRQERRTAEGRMDEGQAALRAELAASRQSTEAAADQRDRLLATLSHDLRGPLNSIYGWVQLLQGGRLDAASQSRALASIARAAQSQAQLIETIVDLGSALRGALHVQQERIDLGALLGTVRAARIQLSEPDATPGEAPIWILGDRRRLQQMFDGLIDEAGRHLPRDQRLVMTEHVRDADIEVRIERSGTPPTAPPGTRHDGNTRASAALLLAREIAILHGAAIDETSNAADTGVASPAFSVRLPLAPTPVDALHPAATSRQQAQPVIAHSPAGPGGRESTRHNPASPATLDVPLPGM